MANVSEQKAKRQDVPGEMRRPRALSQAAVLPLLHAAPGLAGEICPSQPNHTGSARSGKLVTACNSPSL